jgi:mRNA-degrading endonuclease RelE of RelBE toxin-antitoxin system
MEIVETSFFTKQVIALLSDEEYHHLQLALVLNPCIAPIIPNSGGLRKLRWALAGRGKRGGARVIYYWAVADDKILMLSIYAKNKQEDLSKKQLKVLRKIIKEEYP